MVMAMAENEATDDQKELKSSWKTPLIEGEKSVDAPVVGAESWPALAHSHQRSRNPPPSTPAPASPAVQGECGQQKSNGSVSASSHKHSSLRHQNSGSTRNANVMHRFPVPLPYQHPPMPPIFPGIVPPPHVAIPGYAYPPFPGPFRSNENQVVKPESQSTMPAFVPPVQSIDASRNVQPLPQGDLDASVATFSNRRHMQEPGGRLNHWWRQQEAFNPRGSIPLQQGTGLRLLVRPQFFGPSPGFMVGPGFPGPVYYVPVAPPGSMRGPQRPCFVPYPIIQGPPTPSSEIVDRRSNMVKQIEYYFSDDNLQNDHYLISLMDNQGWVPIDTIADFKRVKRMSTDMQFILDSLMSSSIIEVQDGKIRRRDEWLKWIPESPKDVMPSKAKALPDQLIENVTDSHDVVVANKDDSRDSNKENVVFQPVTNSSEHAPVSQDDSEVTRNANDMEMPEKTPGNFGHNRNGNVEVLSDLTVQIVGDLSNDFANTFMLDEELELEQKTVKKDMLSTTQSSCSTLLPRMDDGDDDMGVNDQDVQRLVIVTQEVKTKRFNCRKNFNKDSITRSPSSVPGTLDLKKH